MKYVVYNEFCGLKGSEHRCEYFNTLMEAWNFYRNFPVYSYAGNDYNLVEKPRLVEYDNKESGYNDHHFYTREWRRITKEHNLKNGYVCDIIAGKWIDTKEKETINLFDDLPF